jgi:hypothetical protein
MAPSESIRAHIERCRGELQAAAKAVPEELWQKCPACGGWSAAEVVAHVLMVEQAITEGARKLISVEPRRFSLRDRLHPPLRLAAWRGVKRQSPIPLDRALLDNREAMLVRLAECRSKTLALVDENLNRNLRPWRWKHPFFGALNYYEWFRVMGYHDLRHAKQIREIVDSFRK